MEFVTEVCYNYKFIQDVFLPHIHTTIDKISTRNKVVIYKTGHSNLLQNHGKEQFFPPPIMFATMKSVEHKSLMLVIKYVTVTHFYYPNN